jgi:hypothetical protein
VPWAVVEESRRDIRDGDTSEARGDNVTDRLKDLGYL